MYLNVTSCPLLNTALFGGYRTCKGATKTRDINRRYKGKEKRIVAKLIRLITKLVSIASKKTQHYFLNLKLKIK
ncbi:hypothetical protein O9G_003863 [Rozella allomycis CSF55]|uniref:Uncharacterized protein n=1 Tax=Rozella allomycis (strain CSF55) TaxID=988480 RepID=A0A075B1K4_ROZAC|nr:hypothetical protein O9G_003863 [Rozella allomycis CSF55]|eukprot:EPZ36238.1 hypothetical protein O9G_003863 [Rozella allomycis CSF55]